MRFAKKEIPGALPGTTVTLFQPAEPYLPAAVPNRRYTPIGVEGYGTCDVRSDLLRMALQFRGEYAERRAMGHDCAVFALACALDDPLRGWQPYAQGIQFPEERSEPATHANLASYGRHAGEIVCSYSVEIGGRPPFEARTTSFHAQVRATHTDSPPLFFSKFGMTGDVMLHELQQGMNAYPAMIVYQSGMPVVAAPLAASR